ncbi:MAG: DUF4174 domain-containing protein [Pseudomonadota bacterium]
MQRYRWKNRPLVIFAPSVNDPRAQRQRAIVRVHRRGFLERDMVVLLVTPASVTTLIGRPPALSARQLRARFSAKPGAFRVVLVGKDGGAKRASAQPFSARTLFATIDAMPMRRREMQRRSG